MGLIILPEEPKSGDPVRALDVAALIRYVRSITPRTSRDVRPNISTDGTTFDIISASRKGSKPKPFDLVPALHLPDYESQDDGKDFRRYYVRWGLLNGTPVSGTLQQDGSIGDDSTLIEIPEDATKFIVWIGVGASIEPGDYGTGGWPCTLKFAFTSAGPSGESVPTIYSGKDGWTEYPFQPPALRGVDISGYAGYCTDPYMSITQTCYCPIAIVTKDPETNRLVVEQNVDHHMDLVLTYLGGAGNADHPPPVVPTFSISTRVEDITDKTPASDDPCAGDCEEPNPGEQGGGPNPYGDLVAQGLDEHTPDQLYRYFGSWLYRLFRPANPGHADSNNWRTVQMQDGLLFTGSGADGEGDPITVSFDGVVVPSGVGLDDPYLIALEVDFQNLCGLGSGANAQFQGTITHGLASELDVSPEYYTASKTPTGWPSGCTIANVDNGKLYMVLASITTEDGVMVITEHFRDQASFVLRPIGGPDGVTASTGLLIPMHLPLLVGGKAQIDLLPLLADHCFDKKPTAVYPKMVKTTSGASIYWDLQQQVLNGYYYMGSLAYQDDPDTVDFAAVSGSDQIEGYDCTSS